MTGALSPSSLSITANPALEPAAVRDGSPAVKQAYSEALGFESLLVNQLCDQLISSAGVSGSDAGGSAGLGGFASMLPGALSSSIMSDGGLGLAAQLLPSFESSAGGTSGGEAGA